MTLKRIDDKTTYIKANNHKDVDLKGQWEVYIKIDGVRAIKDQHGHVVSREGKPLYNLDSLKFKDAEIYRKDWSTSVSLVRTQSPRSIKQCDVYELTDGIVDTRLLLGIKMNPTNEWLQRMMKKYVELGHEGIVVRKGAKWIKVVPLKMADVRITGMKAGNGRNLGKCGSIETNHGSVGSFMTQTEEGIPVTDAELRQWLWDNQHRLVGKIIQAGYRETTSKGKLRFPVLVRFRWDKTKESLT
jgi:hypothetical protein